MAHRRAGASPRPEAMESRTLLSHAAAPAAAPPTHAEVAPATAMTLRGTTRGVFHEHPQGDLLIFDYEIKAAGKLTPIGAATITGVLQEHPGTEDNGPSGSLDLITSKGTLTLDMPDSFASPAESSPIPTSPHEIVVTYDIGGGTGAYRNDTGTGVVDFDLPAIRLVKGIFPWIRIVKGIQTGRVDVKFATMPKATTTT